MSEINDKQKRFADEYLIDYNGTQAAIRAGYSRKTSYAIAGQLLQRPEVQAYLKAKSERIGKKLDVSAERTLLEISRVAFQDARMFFHEDGSLIPIHGLSDDAAAVIAGFEIEELFEHEDGVKNKIGQLKKIKRFDKMKALELLAKYYKLIDGNDLPMKLKIVIKKDGSGRTDQ